MACWLQESKPCAAPAYSRNPSGEISAVHVDAAVDALNGLACLSHTTLALASLHWPRLASNAPATRATLSGCWASRQLLAAHAEGPTPCPSTSTTTASALCPVPAAARPNVRLEEAEDVVPRTQLSPTCTTTSIPTLTAPAYQAPARRQGAQPTLLTGHPFTYQYRRGQQQTEAAVSVLPEAAYTPPHRRSASQQQAAAEAGRPGRLCSFPTLVYGPQIPSPILVSLAPTYLMALLSR